MKREQRKRMVVLGVATFFIAAAGEFHSPVLSQYVYQVGSSTLQYSASIRLSGREFHTSVLTQTSITNCSDLLMCVCLYRYAF
jgi:hypothetical protein